MIHGAEPDGDPVTSASDATEAVGPPTAALGEPDETAAVSPPTAVVGAPTAAVGAPTAAAGEPDETAAVGAPTAAAYSGAGRASRPARRGSGRAATTGPTRGQLGAGLVDVPPVPVVDPVSVLMTDPTVPEDRRFCSRCGQPVGRGVDGRPGAVEGRCDLDGTPFSYAPKLRPGELVAGQYEVRGCLAHGGLGWIYLAVDHNVSDRWVVLKGLLDAGDAEAMAAALAERRFLAEVDHPNIVKIHNFVQHPGSDGVPVGYIVMEYVGGSSLRQLLHQRRRPDGSAEPLPVAQAIAYALEGLNALGYLHARGLAYCDFKPDNAIQYDRQLKLIDMGAVIRMDDQRSAVFGTMGYQAPEIARLGPSPASDVYTVGRSLAVLALGLSPTVRGTPNPLPAEHPVLREHESFHRVLLRATDPDPLRRFECAEEMAEQLDGVLREVLAARDGKPRPGTSARFGPPRASFATRLLVEDGILGAAPGGGTSGAVGRPDPARVARALPVPLVDPADPAAGLLASLATVDRGAVTRAVASATELTPELRLRLVRAHLDAGDTSAATEVLDELAAAHPGDWRLEWFRGLTALACAAGAEDADGTPDGAAVGTPEGTDGAEGTARTDGADGAEGAARTECLDRAAAAFEVVYATLPGEAAPKLALAATAECAGRDADAGRHYTLIARPDPGLADAAFGRARVALRAGDRAGAVAALDAVPGTSSKHVGAQLAAVTAVLLGRSGAEVGRPALLDAAARLRRLELDAGTEHRAKAALLAAALDLADDETPPDPATTADGAAASDGAAEPGGRVEPDRAAEPDGRVELDGAAEPAGSTLLGHPWRGRELRLGLERCLRAAARLSASPAERVALVDRANAVRPRTWM